MRRPFRILAASVALQIGVALLPAYAARQDCARIPVMLWGDGKHDDTAALNAWLQGRDAIWADTGEAIGAAITGRIFRLSSAIYVQAGTGRVLRDFRLEWPERSEIVSGGTITAGGDPEAAPGPGGGAITGARPCGAGPCAVPRHGSAAATRPASS